MTGSGKRRLGTGSRTVAAIFLAAIAMSLAGEPPSVSAFSAHENDQNPSFSICVREGLSDVSLANVDNQLDFIVAQWEEAASVKDEQALDITVNAPGASCTADIHVVSDNLGTTNAPVGSYSKITGEITLNDDLQFSPTPELNHYDVGAILAHELGHAIGVGHSGDGNYWNTAGTKFPTMSHAATINSDDAQTIEGDDAGAALWSRDDGIGGPWSANTGFEDNLQYWKVKNGTASAGTGDAFSGTKRARVDSGASIDSTHTYDPWNPEADDLYNGMDDLAVITISAVVKDNNGGAGSGNESPWE